MPLREIFSRIGSIETMGFSSGFRGARARAGETE